VAVSLLAELQAQIVRLYHAEKWPPNTIARQLGVHHSAVTRVLAQAGVSAAVASPRASVVDPYVGLITETLARFPTLTATRLYVMARERGYRGSASQFRYRVSLLRPRKPPEAYLRLRTLPGEQAQVDWGHFGHLQVGRARRPLMAFVMVLSYSRALRVRFFLDARGASFLAGHVHAFEAFAGVPRVILYDNLKSAVLERSGCAIRFNPALLALAAHYRFEPRPVAVARGNEKGRVERAIRYVRDSFFAARSFTDLDDLNDQASAWCQGLAAERPCPENPALSVGAAFEAERGSLLALPDDAFAAHERLEVCVGKTPYVRFDLNDYSVPHECVRRTLTVVADLTHVRITEATRTLAVHPRSFGRGEQIEDPAHVAALAAAKNAARQHRATDALVHALPAAAEFLAAAAAHGYNLGSVTAALDRLRARHNPEDLEAALREALGRGVPHPNAVTLALERLRELRRLPPPNPVNLPEHLRQRDAIVTPHRLDSYDQLAQEAPHDEPQPAPPDSTPRR
jgi:transposase